MLQSLAFMLFTSNMLGMINILTAHCLLIDNSKWLPSQNTVAQGITYLVCSSHSSFLFIPCWFLPVPVASLCTPDSRLCQTPHRQFVQCLSWWRCWKYSWEGARDCSVDSNIFLFSCALWKLNSFCWIELNAQVESCSPYFYPSVEEKVQDLYLPLPPKWLPYRKMQVRALYLYFTWTHGAADAIFEVEMNEEVLSRTKILGLVWRLRAFTTPRSSITDHFFRFTNSSTLHSYECLWVSEWVGRVLILAWLGACFYIENGVFFLTKVHVFGVNWITQPPTSEAFLGHFSLWKGIWIVSRIYGLALTFPKMVWKSLIGLKMTDWWSFKNF